MHEREPFRAIVTDMDSVIRHTASLHQRAWKRTLDAFLRERGLLHGAGDERREGDDPRHGPFTGEEYWRLVDGKPRFEGVRDFLASRGIELPEGDPTDEPDRDTVHGLGNRKNAAFRSLLEEEGAEVFDDAIAAVDRWRRGGLPVAVISVSRNCRLLLRSAGILNRFDAVVDGEEAARLGLAGKPELLREAALRLGVEAGRAVAVEDSVAGARAAAKEGFGLVARLARRDGSDRAGLEAAGADVVAPDLAALRFPREIPDALDRRTELVDRGDGRRLAVFLDFDGTLSPIVPSPGDARLADGMRPVIEALAEQAPVAIVSGRDRPDVEGRVDVDGLFYAGSHGLDIAGPGRSMTLPEAEAVVGEVDRVEAGMRVELGNVPGVVLERKRFSLAVHYRMVADGDVETVLIAVDEAAAEARGLRLRSGKKVVELEPDLDWDKGRAVAWIMDALGIDLDRYQVLYVGDDETDEDAFRALAVGGIGIRVGPGVMSTRADYRLAGPEQVREFLGWLAEHPRAQD